MAILTIPATPSATIPVTNSPTAATAGTVGTYATGNHAHPAYNLQPADCNFSAWNFDPALAQTGFILPANGTVVAIKVNVPIALTVTNINLYLSVAGSVLTSGQNFVALYGTSKELLSQSADQTASGFVGAVGIRTIALSAAQAVAAGTYYVAIWGNGAVLPTFRSSFNNASANLGLAAATSRWATADTSITTTGPSTLGTFTAVAGSPWVAFS